MALFGKKDQPDAPETTAATEEPPRRDARKAKPWFERAKSMADAQNYDYAVQCYISGLQFDPETVGAHEALREASLRRKVQGGKPAGWRDKPPTAKGRSHVDRMLAAEYYFAMDPTAAPKAMQAMEEAIQASEVGEADLHEVAYWLGTVTLEANRNAKRPSKQIYLKTRDLFASIEAYDKAVEASSQALQMDPQNAALIRETRDLQAELTLDRGGYGGEEGGFRKGIKDADRQRALEQDQAIAAGTDQLEQRIARLRADYEDGPEDIQRLEKLVRALRETEEKVHEDEAIKLLEQAREQTGQYRYKMQIGDVRMKQFNRAFRDLTRRLQANPNDGELAEQRKRIAAAQARFELEEYGERVKNYPTDMGLRYELGRRQFALRQYDDAIASFQEAQADPKHRSRALRYLGESFFAKQWYDEAIDTFRRGIEEHERSDDKTALELRYDLMNALETKARETRDVEMAQEANRIASQIAQTDINFKDIRKRVDALRSFLAELKQDQA